MIQNSFVVEIRVPWSGTGHEWDRGRLVFEHSGTGAGRGRTVPENTDKIKTSFFGSCSQSGRFKRDKVDVPAKDNLDGAHPADRGGTVSRKAGSEYFIPSESYDRLLLDLYFFSFRTRTANRTGQIGLQMAKNNFKLENWVFSG